MRISTLSVIWAASPLKELNFGISKGGYTHLREMKANIQMDTSEIDAQSFGEYLNEIIKFRFERIPPLSEGDEIYFTRPEPKGFFVMEGQEYQDYGFGDYTVSQVKPAFLGTPVFRNPTIVVARKRTEDGNDSGGV